MVRLRREILNRVLLVMVMEATRISNLFLRDNRRDEARSVYLNGLTVEKYYSKIFIVIDFVWAKSNSTLKIRSLSS